MNLSLQFRKAQSSEDVLIAEHFYYMWRDNGISSQAIKPDWQEITLMCLDLGE